MQMDRRDLTDNLTGDISHQANSGKKYVFTYVKVVTARNWLERTVDRDDAVPSIVCPRLMDLVR